MVYVYSGTAIAVPRTEVDCYTYSFVACL